MTSFTCETIVIGTCVLDLDLDKYKIRNQKMLRVKNEPSLINCLLRDGRLSVMCNASRIFKSKSLLPLDRTENFSEIFISVHVSQF